MRVSPLLTTMAYLLRPPRYARPLSGLADGVHPSPVGHALMAQTWLRAVKAL
jgi:lysophospholipase L1-like esterase